MHVYLKQNETLATEKFIHNTGISTPYIERPYVDNGNTIWQPPKL